MPRDLAGAPVESIQPCTTGDPKSAVLRGQRRDDTFFPDRRIVVVPRLVTSRFRRDRIQSCYAVVCREPDEAILVLADLMCQRHGSACVAGLRSILLEVPRHRVVSAERILNPEPYASRSVLHQRLGNDETGAPGSFAVRNAHETVAVVAPQTVCRTEPEEPLIVLDDLSHHETCGWPR